MFDHQASFRSWRDGSEYVLVRRGLEPASGLWPFELVDPSSARRIVISALEDCCERPDWPLLRFLGIHEHPYNLHPADLQRTLELALAGIHAPDLYRELRDPLPAQDAVMPRAPKVPPPAPEPVKPRSFVMVELLSTTGEVLRGVRLEVTLPDGSVRTLVSDVFGRVGVDVCDDGNCGVAVPRLD